MFVRGPSARKPARVSMFGYEPAGEEETEVRDYRGRIAEVVAVDLPFVAIRHVGFASGRSVNGEVLPLDLRSGALFAKPSRAFIAALRTVPEKPKAEYVGGICTVEFKGTGLST